MSTNLRIALRPTLRASPFKRFSVGYRVASSPKMSFMPSTRSSRLVGFALAALVLLTTPAFAAQTELEEAEEEAANTAVALTRAEAVRAAAEVEYSASELALGLAVAEFADAQHEYQLISGKVLEVQGAISDAETRLANLRDSVIATAVDSYMALSSTDSLQPFVATSDALDALVHAELASVVAERGTRTIADFSAVSDHLGVQRTQLLTVQAELSELSDKLELQQLQMETLFEEAAVNANESRAQVAATDAAYRRALTRVEEENRRLASLVGSGSWRALVAEFFPAAHVEEALAIMQCESSGNPNAVNPTSGASGLFQFLESSWLWASPLAGYGGASRFDPVANVASAAWLFQYTVKNGHRNGIWAHWECRRVLY